MSGTNACGVMLKVLLLLLKLDRAWKVWVMPVALGLAEDMSPDRLPSGESGSMAPSRVA